MTNTDPNATDDVVSLRGIRKQYGKAEVLKGVDLDVRRGQAVAVIGPSGSGKTTLLRCVNGLETPDAGVVAVGRHRIDYGAVGKHGAGHRRALRTLREDCGMVFQHFNLFPHMTVLRNITYTPRVRGVSTAEAEQRALTLLERVGLVHLKGSYPSQLSGGQQQRVAIARALALQPEVMLFDEATSALDPETVGDVLRVMRELADGGTTMLVVTHEMGFARDSCDEVVFMDGGVVVEHGPTGSVIGDPQHARTKEFLRRYSDGAASGGRG
jgi:ABC-type polar amino acid transport system ATPase subunit